MLFSSIAFSQISISSLQATTINNAGQGDLYLTTDTNQLYIGLSDGTISLIGNESASGWRLTGNTGIASSSFLGTTDDVKMNIGSNNITMLEFGKRSTLGLVQSFSDYTDVDQYLVHLKGNGGVSALQFEASGAGFYKPMFFTTTDGNFRLKGSAAGTDYFEMGSTGTNNNGSFEFIVGDDGDEPFIFKKYNYTTQTNIEMMRLQGTGLDNNVRVGIKTNGAVANSVLQVGGSLSLPIIRLTGGSINLDENHYTIILTPGTYSNPAVLLPTAASCIGRVYVIKNYSGATRNTNLNYRNRSGLNTINLVNLRNFMLQSDGVEWQLIIGNN